MFKQFFRLTVVAYIWKRYKTIIISTLVLFIFFWVVSQLHADYVSYGDLNHDKQYIGLSFVIKWIAFVAGLVVYFLVNSWAFRSSKRNNAKNNQARSIALPLLSPYNNRTSLPINMNGKTKKPPTWHWRFCDTQRWLNELLHAHPC